MAVRGLASLEGGSYLLIINIATVPGEGDLIELNFAAFMDLVGHLTLPAETRLDSGVGLELSLHVGCRDW